MKIILVLSLATVLLFACKSDEKVRITTLKELDGSKKTISFIIKNNDTILHGKTSFYLPNGILKESVEYKEGMKSGWEIRYDSSGKIIEKFYYKNGTKEGAAYRYDANGKIKIESYFINNHQVYSKGYYQNFIPIAYNVFKKNGDVQYVVLIDSLGRKFYENGFVFDDSVEYASGDKNSIQLNKEEELRILTSSLPGYSKNIDFLYFDSSHRKQDLYYRILDSGFLVNVRFIPPVAGKATIALIGKLRDDRGVVVKQDTLVEAINVLR